MQADARDDQRDARDLDRTTAPAPSTTIPITVAVAGSSETISA